MSEEKVLLNCYNRGCGKKFDPNDNREGDCVHHPGQPVFHDAYKGWSCCNKKCIDFTEFLNIKGCTKSCHSNVKPVEPEKPAVDKSKSNEIIQMGTKINNNEPTMERPSFYSPQVTLKPTVSSALLEQIKGLTASKETTSNEYKISIGQSCKNNSCKATYEGPSSEEDECIHHPGVPVFHEGMKYWSCCQKKTSEFSVFLEQVGCTKGKHVWLSKNTQKKIQCRLDWHQTPAFIVVSVFAKKYQPSQSFIKLNPIRLSIDLFFIEENSRYNVDLELKGIVDVAQSTVNMLPTKIEIQLKKAEPGFWTCLEIRRVSNEQPEENAQAEENISSQIDAVDLSDL